MNSLLKNLTFLSVFVSLLFSIHYINMVYLPIQNASKRIALKKVKNRLYEKKREQGMLSSSTWAKYKVDENLKNPVASKDDWCYKWNIIKHNNGFENIASDTVTAQDTIHLMYNAWCHSFLEKEGREFQDTLSDLRFCKYLELKNKLEISIYDESASNSEILKIDLQRNKFDVSYETAYVFPYEDIHWTIKEKQLTLNKQLPLNKRDILVGNVSVKVEEKIFYKNPKPPTKRTKVIKGIFKVLIK